MRYGRCELAYRMLLLLTGVDFETTNDVFPRSQLFQCRSSASLLGRRVNAEGEAVKLFDVGSRPSSFCRHRPAHPHTAGTTVIGKRGRSVVISPQPKGVQMTSETPHSG